MSFFTKQNKYKNKIVDLISGEKFDSKKEYARWCKLKMMEQAGLISNLQRQVRFELIPAQYDIVEVCGRNKTVRKKKLVERECVYVADFVYFDNSTGKEIVEDVKSKITKTPDYVIKRKLMLYLYGIKINEFMD